MQLYFHDSIGCEIHQNFVPQKLPTIRWLADLAFRINSEHYSDYTVV